MRTRYTEIGHEYRRRWTRTVRWSLLASLLIHASIVLLLSNVRPLPDVHQSAAGPDAGDDAAAQGGGLEVLSLLIAQPQPEPVPEETAVPIPVPVVVPVPPVEIRPEPVTITTPVRTEGNTGAGQGVGAEVGAGLEAGTGAGGGGTGAEGTARTSAPTPRGLMLPPADRPDRVRGTEVTVYVFVTDRGRVVSDSTRLAPTTGDRGFDDRLRRQAAEWVFNPARREGQPVAEWFSYTIIL